MKTIFLLTTALTLLAGIALAQQGKPGAHFIEQWDIDGDGQVILSEAEEKRGGIFDMFDQAGDGKLDADDWAGVAEHLEAEEGTNGPGLGMGNGPGKFIHEAMTAEFNDADGNGEVTAEEFVAATKRLFPQIDRNGDGVISSADFGKI